jgi:hypothetical protein
MALVVVFSNVNASTEPLSNSPVMKLARMPVRVAGFNKLASVSA